MLWHLNTSVESWGKVLQVVEQIPDAPTRPPCIASVDCRLQPPPSDTPTGEREEPTRLLIGICSCAKARERRDAIRATWLKKLPAYAKACFFIGGGSVPPGEENDTIALDVPDTYAELSQKIFAFFRHALASDREFGWLFKCDDDTYLTPIDCAN